jgi:hypothetical protein
VRVTHPFHPLSGRDFEFVAHRQNWGEDRVHLHDENGGEPWVCVWCKAANDGYSPRDDPATATLGDLAADMASHGLEFASREPQQEQARDTLPVLIVTTNEVPGCRITQVHRDVFGLIVRARSAFSNMGAQLWWKRPDGPVSSWRRRRLHSRS